MPLNFDLPVPGASFHSYIPGGWMGQQTEDGRCHALLAWGNRAQKGATLPGQAIEARAWNPIPSQGLGHLLPMLA